MLPPLEPEDVARREVSQMQEGKPASAHSVSNVLCVFDDVGDLDQTPEALPRVRGRAEEWTEADRGGDMIRQEIDDYEAGILECHRCDSLNMNECLGVEGDCCGKFICRDCYPEGRCADCDRRLDAEREKANFGFRMEPVAERDCDVCGNYAHRHALPAVYCKSCHGPTCADCLVWEDVCDDCSRAWKKLRLKKL